MRPLLLILLILTFAIVVVNASYARDLELKLLFDKDTYLIGEPIWIDILVINHGDSTLSLLIPEPLFCGISFTVVNNGKDTLRYIGDHAESLGSDNYESEPGDTLYALYNLLDGYPLSNSPSPLIQKPLQGDVEINARYWGVSTSETKRISIISPEGDEKAAYSLLAARGEGFLHRAPVKNLEAIVQNYPRSVYAALAADLLSGAYGITYNDSTRHKYYAMLILEEYPNSGYVKSGVGKYIGRHDDPNRGARIDSLLMPGNSFRVRMLARNKKLGRLDF